MRPTVRPLVRFFSDEFEIKKNQIRAKKNHFVENFQHRSIFQTKVVSVFKLEGTKITTRSFPLVLQVYITFTGKTILFPKKNHYFGKL